MDSKGTLALYITANASQFSAAIGAAQKKFEDFGNKMQSVGVGLTAGLTLPLVAFAAKARTEFQETQQALAQVEAGLRSTGNAAGYSSTQLEAMAKSLQGKSIFSDDEILRGVTAQMLTFTKVTGKAFEGAQQAALDLSSRLGQDLQTSAIQLGKALNDPIKGLASLSKIGVSFSEDQKAVIKAMVETGDIAGAQAVILQELNTEFGGSAQAALDAGGGVIGLRNSFNDLAETVGSILAPYLQKATEFLKGIIDRFQELSPETQKVVVAIGALAAGVGPLLIGVGKLSVAFGPSGALSAGLKVLPGLFAALTGPIGLIIGAVALAATAIIANWDKVKAYFTSGDGSEMFSKVQQAWEQLKDAAIEIFNAIVDTITFLWDTFGEDIINTITAVVDELVGEFQYGLELLTASVKLFRKVFEGDWSGVWDIVKNIWKVSMNYLIQFLANQVNNFLEIWDKVFSFFGAEDFIDPAINAVNSFADSIKFEIPKATKDSIESFADMSAKISTGLKRNTDEATALGDAISNATARPDVSNLQPIGSVGTDNLSIPGATDPAQLTTGFDITDKQQEGLSVQEQMNAKVAEAIEINAKAEAAYVSLGETIGTVFEQSGQTIKEYFQNVFKAIANTIRQIIKAQLAQAIAGYIAKSVSALGPAGIAVAAAAPAVIGGLFDALIPKFAQGGMVTGPMLAMVGDNASGKEAIIPFEKMGSFLNQFGGGGTQRIIVDGVISGNDLKLVMRETDRTNLRNYGRTF
jgi:hypothetical protein